MRPCIAGAFAALLALGACTPAQNGGGSDVSAGSDARVTMERQPCFGFCPVYTLDITRAGQVTFTGERNVDSTGVRTKRIDGAAATALIDEIVDAGFLDFDDEYTMGAKGCGSYHTDAPWVILTLDLDGRTKTVTHDYGCGGAPAALRRIHERIDSVAGVARWVVER